MDIESAKNIHFYKLWVWALEEGKGSWFGFHILIMIWIWFLSFDKTLVQIFVVLIDIEWVNTIYIYFKSKYQGLEEAESS